MQANQIAATMSLCGLLLAPLSVAAALSPPADAKPLSTILASVEQQNLGSISEVEWDDGQWEVKVCTSRIACRELYIDPRTGATTRNTRAGSGEIPPAGAMAVSGIVESIEASKQGTIRELEFDDGFWEIKLRDGVRRTGLLVDPMTGKTTKSW